MGSGTLHSDLKKFKLHSDWEDLWIQKREKKDEHIHFLLEEKLWECERNKRCHFHFLSKSAAEVKTMGELSPVIEGHAKYREGKKVTICIWNAYETQIQVHKYTNTNTNTNTQIQPVLLKGMMRASLCRTGFLNTLHDWHSPCQIKAITSWAIWK